MKIELAKSEVIHFVGIGGIGMSGLSMIMKRKVLKFKEAISQIIKILIGLEKKKSKFTLDIKNRI